MSRSLNLLCFKQYKFLPNNTYHWALFLHESNSNVGTMFHVSKPGLSDQTNYFPVENLDVTMTQSLQQSIEVASGLTLDFYELDTMCKVAAHNRVFNLGPHNCQRFCTEMLQRLVNNGTITQNQFDALDEKGFKPLI